MKKVLAIAAVLMFVASSAHAVPAVGTEMVSASGTISLKPDAVKNIYLSGSYGKFISEGIMVGGGLSVAKWNGVDDINVAISLTAQYWMGLSDGLDMFAGLDIGMPVMPDFDATGAINVGVAHWLSGTTALTAGVHANLGSLKDFNADNLTVDFVIGLAQFL
jgi:hypothetical protein